MKPCAAPVKILNGWIIDKRPHKNDINNLILKVKLK